MVKARRKTGFTLAEMMIVVGILAILMAVAFIGIIGYLRSMEKLEFDGYAREIFISAQNHLAVAENQGYYGLTSEGGAFGIEEGANPGVYYFVVRPTRYDDLDNATSLLGQMLPFASIDETVRKGTSGYLIRYHKDSAQILDVFYWKESGSRYSHTYDADSDVVKKDGKVIFFGGDTSRSALRKYGNSVIGYYGGEDAAGLEKGDDIKAPEIQVVNEDKLYVRIKENNDDKVKNKGGYTLKLVVTGKTSGEKKEVELYSTTNNAEGSVTSSQGGSSFIVRKSGPTDPYYVVVMDDVTEAGRHFADFAAENAGAAPQLIPGEDVSIQAVASNNAVLTNVAYSSQQTTNSLFGVGTVVRDNSKGEYSTAIISSIRHLENLDPSISKVNKGGFGVLFSEAEQSTDLNWTAFKKRIFKDINQDVFKQTEAQASKSGTADGIAVYSATANTLIGEGTAVKGYFYPLSINTSDLNLDDAIAWTYKGQMHVISDVDVYLPDVSSFTGAGLFADLTGSDLGADFIVKDLQLVDFSVNTLKAVGAGALAGKISNAEITNVVAYHKAESNADVMSVNGAGHTGGLIGYAYNSKIYKSAAALKVSTTGDNAGGLIGFANGKVDIYSCFSGGHTDDGEYKPAHGSVKDDYNVKAKTNAGGLIGKADETENGNETAILYSYSTCSAMATGADGGTAVGGLVGSIMNSGSSVEYCYSTGLVNAEKPAAEVAAAPKVGALIGDLHTSLTLDNCNYYQIINSVTGDDGSISYLPQLGTPVTDMDNKVEAIDTTATTYDNFVGSGASGTGADRRWRTAYSYDEKLRVFYQGKFNLKTVGQMKALKSHVDDAFAEPKEADGTNLGDFVIHHYGDWPAPETWVFNTPG